MYYTRGTHGMDGTYLITKQQRIKVSPIHVLKSIIYILHSTAPAQLLVHPTVFSKTNDTTSFEQWFLKVVLFKIGGGLGLTFSYNL